MDNDATEHDVDHILSLMQEQMQQIAAMQVERAAITATGKAADGAVEVTVDAQRMVTGTVIDEGYLKDNELADLGGHITTAARAALEEVERRSAALMAPLTERRQEIMAASGSVVDFPDVQQLMSGLLSGVSGVGGLSVGVDGVGDGVGGPEDRPSFPVVRR